MSERIRMVLLSDRRYSAPQIAAILECREATVRGRLYAIHERKRAVEFIAFLEAVLAAYPGRPVLTVVDTASIHTAKAMGAWLAEHPRLGLLFLPTYSDHKENPVEQVCGGSKAT